MLVIGRPPAPPPAPAKSRRAPPPPPPPSAPPPLSVPVHELALLALVAPSQLVSERELERQAQQQAAGACEAAAQPPPAAAAAASRVGGLFGRRSQRPQSTTVPAADAVDAKPADTRALCVAFHPGITLGGAQPALLAGLGCGLGVKLNTPAVYACVTAKPPGLPSTLRAPSGEDARLGAEAAPVFADVRLSVEYLSGGHAAPLVFVGVAGSAPPGLGGAPTLVTLDAAGAVRLWPYARAQLSSFGWLGPGRGGASLELSESEVGPAPGDVPEVLFPPAAFARRADERNKQFRALSRAYEESSALAPLELAQPWREYPTAEGGVEQVFGRPEQVCANGEAEFSTLLRAADGTLLRHLVGAYAMAERIAKVADAASTYAGRELAVLLYFAPTGASPSAYAKLALVSLVAGVQPTPLRVHITLSPATSAATPPPVLALGGALASTASDYAYVLHAGELRVYSLASAHLVKGPIALGCDGLVPDRLALSHDQSRVLVASSTGALPPALLRGAFSPPPDPDASDTRALGRFSASVREGSWRSVVPVHARQNGVEWRFARTPQLPATRHVATRLVVQSIVDELLELVDKATL
ncbi:hypothetical protein T492DRAFT_843989 [Pavlovales sp. CCMP2436]|nr:hypothetical protein T492DRAFT_843989 [Pavlovales sp. CCMP2436]